MDHRTRRAGFTLNELLFVILLVFCVCGVLLAGMVNLSRTRANRASCLGNLLQIGQLASIYAQDHEDQFPFSRAKPTPLAYESFQVLADWDPENVQSRLFCSPVHRDDPAQKDDKGRYTLDASSCSYAYVAQLTRLSNHPSLPLASNDKIRSGGNSEGHTGGMNVVYVGLNAEWTPAADLPSTGLPAGLIGNSHD